MQAFRAGDVAQAFTYASPVFRKLWRCPNLWADGAGWLWPDFQCLQFSIDELIGTMDAPVQVVYFTGTDLTVVAAFYAMVLVPDEGWRINEVQIFPVDQQAS